MSTPEKLFAFVLMPFEDRFDDVYRLGIKAAVEELGMIATRVDEQVFHNEGILEGIYDQIDAADFIIADMTGRNPNVLRSRIRSCETQNMYIAHVKCGRYSLRLEAPTLHCIWELHYRIEGKTNDRPCCSEG